MKRIESVIPIITDTISGAFGGAVLGNTFGGIELTIIGSVLGGAVILFLNIKTFRNKDGIKTC